MSKGSTEEIMSASGQEPPAITDAPILEKQQKVEQDRSTVSVPKDFFFIPVPKHLRHDPENPAHFGLFLNIVFALATTFSAYSLSLFSSLQLADRYQAGLMALLVAIGVAAQY